MTDALTATNRLLVEPFFEKHSFHVKEVEVIDGVETWEGSHCVPYQGVDLEVDFENAVSRWAGQFELTVETSYIDPQSFLMEFKKGR